MNRISKRITATALAALMVLSLAGCASSETAGASIINVKTVTAEKHKLEASLELAGVLVPAQTVNITSKLSGQITELNHKVGDRVEKDEVLVRLETKSLNAQLLQAEAGLQSAQAAVKSAENQAALAAITLDIAQKAYDRTKVLYDGGAASQTQMDDAKNKLDQALRQYENATGSVKDQAQASISTANASINSVKVQIENSVIKSPISGIVVNKNINTGEVASPTAASPIMTIADTSVLKLKGTVGQEMLPLLSPGQEIDVVVDIYRDKTIKGKIESIGPMAISTGAFFPIEISIENSDGIQAGLSAHASIGLSEEKGVVIPISAVVQNDGKSYVYVIRDNTVSKRIVTLGLKNDKEIEVLQGLEAGEKVAATNVNSLFDGIAVNEIN
ncbi:MAG TPA: efflux RND transporter periplasmic adaptor subunit [Negativicutes bacterium]|nr:efflux RND transporter periplasmic adaptor subunit [Negativicutes bacterium]